MSDRITRLRALAETYNIYRLEEKKKELQQGIEQAAGKAAVAALIPIASFVADMAILYQETQHYRSVFGLTKENIDKCASLFRQDPETFLKDIGLKSMLIAFTAEGLKRYATKKATQQLAKFGSFIPSIGQAIAATSAYYGTCHFLEQILDETYGDALLLSRIIRGELEQEEMREKENERNWEEEKIAGSCWSCFRVKRNKRKKQMNNIL